MSGKDQNGLRPATRLVEGGRRKEWTGPVVNTPVWRASTHLYETDAERREAGKQNADGGFFYGRRGAPTQWSLAEALTQIEPGAQGTVLYPSGVAAIAGCMMAVLRPGDRLLMTDNAYDPSRSMATGLLKRLGVETTFFDPLDLDRYEQHFESNIRAVWLESPGSLTMEVCDVPALAAIAREHGAVSMIDNTWAGPLGFAALEHGCDITMMSLSKHVGGHSDLMMGSASAGKRWYRALRRTSQELGQVVSPDDAALASRGLRTMGVRLEKSTRSAVRIATWLRNQPQVGKVMCPLIEGDAGHELWSRDFKAGCGLFSFILASEDPDASAHVADSLNLFGIGYSWGGFESLALPILPHEYRSVMASPTLPKGGAGAKPAIRLSIGLEDSEDLIADLAQALEKMDNS
ncbi:cystathionine beta-lyase [Erythrobacter sp. THAF29]|uniref:cystathionine beta-lyase n=1 Tax=Erythrobacter sp. THAF29 TaxID=2587851 RepID=UPI0012A81A18|nr:cystathionine beta-lyase [Erythrobacter sp. THAF29]QFT77092.1 Cystathionine beta-lyase MetC [Erythrobacter sp. THAF29]